MSVSKSVKPLSRVVSEEGHLAEPQCNRSSWTQMVGVERHCLESPVIQPACYRRRRGRGWIWNVFLLHDPAKPRLSVGRSV